MNERREEEGREKGEEENRTEDRRGRVIRKEKEED